MLAYDVFTLGIPSPPSGIRLIPKSPYNSHTDPLFRQTKLLKIDDIYTMQCIKLFLKNRQQILQQYLSQQLTTNNLIHRYNTRQQFNIHDTPIRTKLEEQQINTKISQSWNNLPISVRDSLKSPSSAPLLKRYLLSQYFTSCPTQNCYICNR